MPVAIRKSLRREDLERALCHIVLIAQYAFISFVVPAVKALYSGGSVATSSESTAEKAFRMKINVGFEMLLNAGEPHIMFVKLKPNG